MRFDEEPNDPHYECGLEIHGLKVEVDRLKDQNKGLRGEIGDLKQYANCTDAENVRLRAALEKIGTLISAGPISAAEIRFICLEALK